MPLLYPDDGENEYEIYCGNEDCRNSGDRPNSKPIRIAIIELDVTIKARVKYR